MEIEKVEGTSDRLYSLVAPLVMRRSVLRQNNNYPFWTSRSHIWFVAMEGDAAVGFVPVELKDNGSIKINNYYVAGDDGSQLTALLGAVVHDYGGRCPICAVVHARHVPLFCAAGFSAVKEWKLYVKMEYGKSGK